MVVTLNGSFNWLVVEVGGPERLPRKPNGSLDWLGAVVGGADKLPRKLNGSVD